MVIVSPITRIVLNRQRTNHVKQYIRQYVKTRQHVNPLSKTNFNLEIDVNKELDYFENHNRMDKAFHIDVGSHNGVYLFGLAKMFPNTNFIGLEIQKRQIEKCFKKREKLLINYQHNLHFIHANIISKKGSFKEFLQEFPKRNGSIQSISILNPDPCFKRRQIKRRMINETVLNYLSDGVEKDTIVYIQSDNEMTFDHMHKIFFSPIGIENFKSIEPENILNWKPSWYQDDHNNDKNMVRDENEEDGLPYYPSFTKIIVENDVKRIEVPIGNNNEKHFLGIPPGREINQMDPERYLSSDGIVWRHVFVKK